MTRPQRGGRFFPSNPKTPNMLRTQILTVLLLTISNVFMTFAWYGHLKFKQSPLWLAILASWLIALFEYCFQYPLTGSVPAS